jgi:FkbM family methyltransferase
MTSKGIEDILFQKDYGRMSLVSAIDSVEKAAAKRRLLGLARVHLAHPRRQLAMFAFDAMGVNINEDGVYELHELDAVFDWLKTLRAIASESVALDLGANIGNHSLYFSDYFERVHCFEPNKRTFKVLALNAELASNVICYNYGLSDRDGVAYLSIDKAALGSSSIVASRSENSEPIEIRRLDGVVSDKEKVRLIKVDVEGHENEALTGAREIIAAWNPIIMFEQHPQDIFGGTSKTIELLRGYGYSKFAVLEREPRVPEWVPRVLVPVAYFAMKLMLPTKTLLRITSSFHPKFYALILALPEWLSVKS